MGMPGPGAAFGAIQQLTGPSRLGTFAQALRPPLGMAMRFDVVIGSLSLGSWSTCRGLSVSCKPDRVRELGVNGYQRVLMPNIEYGEITLERAMDVRSSQEVQRWLTTELSNWLKQSTQGQPYDGQTGRITLYSSTVGMVASWTLWGVHPSKWTGPTLSGKETGVAIESLELVHEGFLELTV